MCNHSDTVRHNRESQRWWEPVRESVEVLLKEYEILRIETHHRLNLSTAYLAGFVTFLAFAVPLAFSKDVPVRWIVGASVVVFVFFVALSLINGWWQVRCSDQICAIEEEINRLLAPAEPLSWERNARAMATFGIVPRRGVSPLRRPRL